MTPPKSRPEKPGKIPDFTQMLHLTGLRERELKVSHLLPAKAVPPAAAPHALDLSGKRKVFFVVGSGATGKTSWLRWLAYRSAKRDAELTLATADQHNLDLPDYYENVGQVPPGAQASGWLRHFFVWLKDRTGSAAINFGGNDSILPALIARYPQLISGLQGDGLEPVLAILLSPRDNDLTVLGLLREVGFMPPATMLICNLGRLDGAPDFTAFNPIIRHSVFTAAVEAGAAHIWMPKFAESAMALDIERARMPFDLALSPGGGFDFVLRGALFEWLEEMERSFAPVASWLP